MSEAPGEPASRPPDLWRRRAPALLALAAVAVALVVAVLTTVGSGHSAPPHRASARVRFPAAVKRAPVAARPVAAPVSPTNLSFRPTGSRLPTAVAGAGATAVGSGNALLLGGIDSAGGSSDHTVEIDAGQVAGQSRLPHAVRYAAAATIAGTAYLFGGQDTQTSAAILQVDPLGGTQMADQLPTPTADAGVAVVAGTAYVVGGSDGSHALDSIVSWQPGLGAHVVAVLPQALRFPAVAAVGGQVIIAGGSTARGASRSILDFDPGTQQVTGLTVLPTPLTHAAATVVNGRMYVLGGQTSGPGTQTDRIESFDPQTGTVSAAGVLPSPLADAAVVSSGTTILLAGGVDDAGQEHDSIYQAAVAGAGSA